MTFKLEAFCFNYNARTPVIADHSAKTYGNRICGELPHYNDLISQPSESGPSVIDVHVNKMYDAGPSISERDPGERRDILQRRKGPSKRIPCTAVLVER